MTGSNNYLPADFNQEELLQAAGVLNENFLNLMNASPVLGKLLHTLHGNIIQEVFVKFGKDDPEKCEMLKKLFIAHDSN